MRGNEMPGMTSQAECKQSATHSSGPGHFGPQPRGMWLSPALFLPAFLGLILPDGRISLYMDIKTLPGY